MSPDLDSFRRLASRAVDEGVTPGLVIAAGREGRTLVHEAFGLRQVEPGAEPAEVTTVYDLASLTKAAVTSLLVMRAVDLGVLHLDRPAGEYLPALAARPEITVRRMLCHAAGFAAHRPFYERVLGAAASAAAGGRELGAAASAAAGGRERIVALAAAEPLVHAPGTRSLYSDIGFMLLGQMVEQVLGGRLDGLAEEHVFRPAGLRATGFAGSPAVAGLPIAATERCPVRGRIVVGEVHDLNAWAMGGIAGHAGLFGTAGDLMRLSSALCAAWRGAGPEGGAPIVPTEVLRLFWQPAGVPGSSWRLGWDGPAAQSSLAGGRLARTAVGHLAFTGCSLWIDPERDTAVVVLSNRIHPEVKDDPRFRALRPALNDAVLEAIGY
jgi:CubicO group peptidase (beta-lactamase class C family)